MAVEFARKGLLGKARARPQLVHRVLEKARREGVLTAIQAVRGRLDRPTPLGYSSAGMVLETGAGVADLRPGDPVACAGAGFAVHGEVVCVPRNLVAKIPAAREANKRPIHFDEAAFSTLGAIAMHGLRLAEPQLGETIAVIGLGLIGLLTVQLARIAGCTVFGMDPDRSRCWLAKQLGCAGSTTGEEELKSLIAAHTESVGADAVILAAATPSQSPVRLAGEVVRSRGRVVAIGAVGTNIPRNLYYEKELNFRISRSYGPGRYDSQYEEKGHDYPIGYVRWTENRNLQSFLALLAQRKIDVQSLITHRYSITDATQAYDLILGKTREPFLGIILTYSREVGLVRDVGVRPRTQTSGPVATAQDLRIGLLGAGNFALGILVPSIRRVPAARLIGVCSATGLSARYAAKKFGFAYSTTDASEILNDSEVNTVVIATPHHLHARQVIAGLASGKNVFCEKPLCISETELAEIIRAYDHAKGPKRQLMVGFNRRFAPMAQMLKQFLSEQYEPLIMHYRVNAGPMPSNSWMRDENQGGRIIGEVCHFVDFLTFLASELPVRVHSRALAAQNSARDDSVVVTLEFANGSLGTITYATNGDRSAGKERIEVFGGSSTGALDDFRRLELVRNGRKRTVRSLLRQDKGHRGEWEAFAAGLKTGQHPIPFEQILATTLATFRILESLRSGKLVEIRLADLLASCFERPDQEFAEHVPAKEIESLG
jgi:predicted dehydrogenase/threonine dehydrogenase-like Zn-dependent dehydrogenase